MALVPDGLPVLSRGRHKSPARGACFMEYTALLAGEPFSDSPACTDPQLAAVLRHANDKLADADRARLVPLLGRAIGLVVPGTPSAATRRRWGRPRLVADPAARVHARLTDELHRAVCGRFASAVGYVPSAVELRLHGHGGDVDRLFWHLMREPTVLATSADWVDRLVARLELLHECYESALLELELAEADLRPAGEPEVGTV